MGKNTSTNFNERSAPVETTDPAGVPAPVLPTEKYVAELEECGFTREQAGEYLETLIPLLWHFVDLGFRGDISEVLVPPDTPNTLESNGNFNIEKEVDEGKELATE